MERIILFDGFCNRCNRSVKFIIKHDKQAIFKFVLLQSDPANAILSKHNLQSNNVDSIVLIRNNSYYLKSTAVLYILKDLRGGWQILFGLIVIPRSLRDYGYDLIAKWRYKLFGKSESCMILDDGVKDRFI